MKKLLREPLLHFLVLGTLLFGLYTIVGGGDEARPRNEIVITGATTDALSEKFAKTWQRPPTSEELESLVQDHIREEVLYREALAMGLDRDDTVVRRRMRQKLEFLSEDLATFDEPTEAELQEYLDAHPDNFRVDSRFDFKQIYFKADNQEQARLTLATLRETGPVEDLTQLGDPLMLDQTYGSLSSKELTSLFGQDFAAALEATPVGDWEGPLASGYGLHLVQVTKKSEGRTPGLEEVREQVTREWSDAKRRESNEAFYKKLREGYTVTRTQ